MSTALQDVLVDGSDWEISLAKLIGRPIKDVACIISRRWGDPVVEIMRVVFEDGSEIGISGEHDIAYLEPFQKTWPMPNLEEDVLDQLSRQQDDEDEEE